MDLMEKMLERTATPPNINVNVVLPDGKRKKASEPDKPLNDEENKGSPVESTGYPRPYTS